MHREFSLEESGLWWGGGGGGEVKNKKNRQSERFVHMKVHERLRFNFDTIQNGTFVNVINNN